MYIARASVFDMEYYIHSYLPTCGWTCMLAGTLILICYVVENGNSAENTVLLVLLSIDYK